MTVIQNKNVRKMVSSQLVDQNVEKTTNCQQQKNEIADCQQEEMPSLQDWGHFVSSASAQVTPGSPAEGRRIGDLRAQGDTSSLCLN